MNLKQALKQAHNELKEYGIENSSLEAEILLRHVLGTDRTILFSRLEKDLTPSQEQSLKELIQRRQWGEPSAYIMGRREFYGLEFMVDRRVLIPRPETELLVEKAIESYKKYNYNSVADIGTGSGCIAVSLAKNLPEAAIYAVDKSLPALEVAEENSKAHKVKDRIELLWGNLLEPLPKAVDMITANLPYVKKSEINSKYEPEMALNGGLDGLDVFRQFAGQLRGKLNRRGLLLMEIGQGQADEVVNIIHNIFPDNFIEVFKDLAGIERVVTSRLTS